MMTRLLGALLAAFAALGSPAFAQEYVISTFAGGASPPTAVSGVEASVGAPTSVAVDAAGNVYFATSIACVFKLDQNGILTLFAGNGHAGYAGDGGPATEAQIGASFLMGVAVDSAGNVFIAEGTDGHLRMVAPNGIITTVASDSTSHVAVDSGGNAYFPLGDSIRKVTPGGVITTVLEHSGGIYGLGGLAIDPTGNIYVADTSRDRVLQVSPAGAITTVADDGAFDNSGVLIPGLYPEDVALDAAGNLYIADRDNNSVFKLAPSRTVTKVAGQGLFAAGYSGDGGPGANAALSEPLSVAADSAGNVFIADWGNNRLRKVAANGIITTVAGNGTQSFAGDGGPAVQAQLGGPSGAALDSAGDLYFADLNNDRIRKILPDGTITTVAGNGSRGSSGDGGPAANAQLNLSTAERAGVALDPAGNLYIADAGNRRIRKVSPDGTIAAVVDGGPYIAADSEGSLYFTDSGSIRKVAPGGAITTVTPGQGPIALDSAGNLYFPEFSLPGYRIRKVSPEGDITTFANVSGSPVALAADSAGNLFIAATALFSSVSNGLVSKVSPGGVVTTIAGTGTPGYSGDGGPATSAQLNASGLAVAAPGDIYVTDSVNNVIRRLHPGELSTLPAPSIAAITNGASNLTGSIAPGEIVVLYGANMGPAQIAQFSLNPAGLVGTSLAGTQVSFNGAPGPILYTSAAQVAAIVPYLVPPAADIQVKVSYQGQTSGPLGASLTLAAPALLTADASGVGQALAIDGGGSLNSAANPIRMGGVIVLYATGEGQTSPPGMDGKPAAAPLPAPLLPVTATIGGKPAEVQYAGGAPGFVAGLMQVNVVIPSNISAESAVPVVLNVGPVPSQSGVTIAVTGN